MVRKVTCFSVQCNEWRSDTDGWSECWWWWRDVKWNQWVITCQMANDICLTWRLRTSTQSLTVSTSPHLAGTSVCTRLSVVWCSCLHWQSTFKRFIITPVFITAVYWLPPCTVSLMLMSALTVNFQTLHNHSCVHHGRVLAPTLYSQSDAHVCIDSQLSNAS